MPRKHLLFLIAFVCLLVAARYFVPKPVDLNTLEDVVKAAESSGLHCVKVADHEYSYLVVSNAPITLEEARNVSMKPQSADTPGIIRSRLIRHDYFADCPNLRIWGKVYAFGDLDVLSKIDPR